MSQLDLVGTAVLVTVWFALTFTGIGEDGRASILVGAALAWLYARKRVMHRKLQRRIIRLSPS
jgi:hypothetical protein